MLGKTLPKDASLRLSDWELLPLSPEQQRYAATDAYASLRICQVCSPIPSCRPSEVEWGEHGMLQHRYDLLGTMTESGQGQQKQGPEHKVVPH